MQNIGTIDLVPPSITGGDDTIGNVISGCRRLAGFRLRHFEIIFKNGTELTFSTKAQLIIMSVRFVRDFICPQQPPKQAVISKLVKSSVLQLGD